MIDMDEQIRTVLSRQADAMVVPDVQPGENIVHVGDLRRPQQRRVWIGVAASLVATLAVGAALVISAGRSGTVTPNDSGSGPSLTTMPVIDGIGTYGLMTLADQSVVAVGVTEGGDRACLLTDWAPKVCDPLPTPVSPVTIPFAHVVQSTLGQPARDVIWGVIQAGFTAVVVSNGVETPVVLSPGNGNGLSGFAQSFESAGAGAHVEIHDSNGTRVQTTPITSTTMSSTDGGSDAWRAAVYQEMSAFGTCATTNDQVGSGSFFNAKTICTHFSGEQPVDGNIVFMLNELPFATLAESVADFTKNGTGNGAAGVPIGTDAVMFVEKSNGVTRRASIVTAKHAVVIYSELLDDKYLPTGDHDLAAVAQDLNKVAGPLIAKAAGANGDGHCILASYIVLEGDTPAGVAQEFNVSVEALKAANVTTPSFETFSVGMKIFIPAQAPFVCTAASPTGGPQDTFPANG